MSGGGAMLQGAAKLDHGYRGKMGGPSGGVSSHKHHNTNMV